MNELVRPRIKLNYKEEFMNSSSTIDVTQEPAEGIAYKYRLDVGELIYFKTITEYFIPSNKICFNESAAFKSEKPRNLSNSKFLHRRSEPLTALTLSQELINTIENAVEGNAFNSLKENEEYQSLFKTHQHKTVLVGNEIIKIKDGFFDRCKIKGNNVIKKAIIKYILNGATPIETSLNDVIQLAKKLSSIEKDSIINSVNETLSIENGKLSEKRSSAIKEIEKNHANEEGAQVWSGGLVGGVISYIFELPIHPIISVGLGLFAASALKNVEGEYKKNNENQLWDRREKRAKMIFDMINDKPENDTKPTKSY
jgi:hypothetical protein